MLTTIFILLAARIHATTIVDAANPHNFAAPQETNGTTNCSLDQSKPPGDLTVCGNQTLFHIFRPRARFIAPEGWMNDPMAMFQRKDGSFHAGYQSHPQHIQWGNISMGAAHSPDMTYWYDFGSWQNYKTVWPSMIYDIRGVFDGSIIQDGWDGFPTMIYTSTYTTPLGAGSIPPEIPGSETQSIAYTKDEGKSWIKLNYGPGANPVIYDWPAVGLTGFRDPYAFLSAPLSKLLANQTSITNATGEHFLTISGGIREDADPVNGGSRLFLYRQTETGDVTKWTYLGPILGTGIEESWSQWSGNFGRNFETAFINRLNPKGRADDDGFDPDAVNIIGFGTEQGRNGSHEDHWPLWSAVDYSVRENGSVQADILYSGVADWGRAYAFTSFPVSNGREVMVGWTYEDDESLTLAKQQGYQGAFTLFRDLYVKITTKIDPNTPGLNDKASWGVRKETDGSISVVTVGQKVIPEILKAYESKSKVSKFEATNITVANYIPFDVQPTGKFYALQGQFQFGGLENSMSMMSAGFRVRASDSEFTDILYNPVTEELTINRTSSSLIKSYGNEAEIGKLKLFNILDKGRSTREPLNLSVFVDNSVLEVYANDMCVITTKIYPWLTESIGAGFLATGIGNDSYVHVEDIELWDGLINAWPERPEDTRQGLVWDGPANGIFGLWGGI